MRNMATRLGAAADVEVLNDVVLNQVLVRFSRAGADADAHTRRDSARATRRRVLGRRYAVAGPHGDAHLNLYGRPPPTTSIAPPSPSCALPACGEVEFAYTYDRRANVVSDGTSRVRVRVRIPAQAGSIQ
jgi:hypothetical protein